MQAYLGYQDGLGEQPRYPAPADSCNKNQKQDLWGLSVDVGQVELPLLFFSSCSSITTSHTPHHNGTWSAEPRWLLQRARHI